MAGRFSIEAVFKAIDKVTAPVSRISNSINKFTRKATRGIRSLNRQVDKLGRGLRGLRTGAAASLAVLGFGLFSLVNLGADFEQAIVSAATKFPEEITKGTQAFKELEDVVRKVGATTEFKATEAAQGLNFLAKAGFNAKQAMVALPGLVDLATASESDLALATDVATDTLGAFGLAVKDPIQLGKNLSRVNDTLAVTFKRANTDMELFFETIKKGGPSAKAGGLSFESFAAFAGIMANSSLKASEAGSVMKNVIIRLAAPTTAMTRVLKKLKVETKDSNRNLRDAADIFTDLQKALTGKGTADALAILDTLFGKRAVTGAAILIETGIGAVKELRDEMISADGAAAQMAKTMRDTLRGDINQLKSATESLNLTFFKLKDTSIGGTIVSLTEFIRTLDNTTIANKGLATEMVDGLIQAVTGAVQIIGVLVSVFVIMKATLITVGVLMSVYSGIVGTFTVVMGAAKVAIVALNLALGLGPLGAILLIITLLVAGGILLIKNWDKIKDTIVSAAQRIKAALLSAFSPLTDIFQGVSKVFSAGGQFKALFGVETEEGEEDTRSPAQKAQVVGPLERAARVQQNVETSKAELTITDKTGRAELTQKGKTPGVSLNLAQSGAF